MRNKVLMVLAALGATVPCLAENFDPSTTASAATTALDSTLSTVAPLVMGVVAALVGFGLVIRLIRKAAKG